MAWWTGSFPAHPRACREATPRELRSGGASEHAGKWAPAAASRARSSGHVLDQAGERARNLMPKMGIRYEQRRPLIASLNDQTTRARQPRGELQREVLLDCLGGRAAVGTVQDHGRLAGELELGSNLHKPGRVDRRGHLGR